MQPCFAFTGVLREHRLLSQNAVPEGQRYEQEVQQRTERVRQLEQEVQVQVGQHREQTGKEYEQAWQTVMNRDFDALALRMNGTPVDQRQALLSTANEILRGVATRNSVRCEVELSGTTLRLKRDGAVIRETTVNAAPTAPQAAPSSTPAVTSVPSSPSQPSVPPPTPTSPEVIAKMGIEEAQKAIADLPAGNLFTAGLGERQMLGMSIRFESLPAVAGRSRGRIMVNNRPLVITAMVPLMGDRPVELETIMRTPDGRLMLGASVAGTQREAPVTAQQLLDLLNTLRTGGTLTRPVGLVNCRFQLG